MRVLFAFPWIPWPPVGGGRTRNWFLSSQLAERHEVHLFCLRAPEDPVVPSLPSLPFASVEVADIPPRNPPRGSAAWLALRVRSLRHPGAAYYRAGAERRFAALVGRLRPDIIVYGISWMLPYARAAGAVPAVADQQNYDPLITARMAQGRRGLDALKWRAYVALTTRAERRNLRRVRAVAACSEEDAALFRTAAPHALVGVVPNGVDTGSFDPSPLGSAIVMTGTFSYAPNADGARWLAREVWPRVRRAAPAAELRLVGLDGELLGDLAGDGITVVGTVPDIRPELARARAAVAPIHAGGGTRIKILEAFAAGRPVVATRIGAEGLGLADADAAFLRDGPAAFADALVRLLSDVSLARAMGERGRKLAESRFDWRAGTARLEALLERALA